MPKAKTRILPEKLATIDALLLSASSCVIDTAESVRLSSPDIYSEVRSEFEFENPEAILAWSNDCMYAVEMILEKTVPMPSWDYMRETYVKDVPMGLMNLRIMDLKHLRLLSRKNVFKKAPYIFLNEQRKIVAYFLGNKALSKISTYAWQYERIFARSGATSEMRRKAFVYAKHAAACYYAVTGAQYSARWNTWYMQEAFAGTITLDDVLNKVCTLIKEKATSRTLPDIWEMLEK